MSRTSQILSSPCKKYLKWKTIKDEDTEKITGGAFVHYDKDLEENVVVDIPFTFAVLDPDPVCFKGFNEKKKSGVWSNEVKLPDHEVVLKDKDGVIMKFLLKDYKAKKGEIELTGAKYTKSVYIAHKPENADEMEIWNLQLSGAALTGGVDRDNITVDEKNDGWFAFTKNAKQDIYKKMVTVGDFKVKKKGATKFTAPVYKLDELISQEESAELDKMDIELKKYLTWYYKRGDEPIVEKEAVAEEAPF